MTTPRRVEGGKWAKGASGNPGGRRRGEQAGIDWAQAHGIEMLSIILHLARNAESQDLRFRAATYLADRAYGKAKQAVDLEASGGGDITVIIRKFGGDEDEPEAGTATPPIEASSSPGPLVYPENDQAAAARADEFGGRDPGRRAGRSTCLLIEHQRRGPP